MTPTNAKNHHTTAISTFGKRFKFKWFLIQLPPGYIVPCDSGFHQIGIDELFIGVSLETFIIFPNKSKI